MRRLLQSRCRGASSRGRGGNDSTVALADNLISEGPLHCVDRNGDRDGNDQRVFYRQQKKAVHLRQVWHTLVLRDAMKGTHVAVYVEKLAEGVGDEQVKAWARGNAQAW